MAQILLNILILSFGISALGNDGLYTVQGSHNQRGSYQGQVRIEGNKFEKLIEYQDFQFKGLKVQEVWSGDYDPSTGKISLNLKPSEVLTEYEGVALPPGSFSRSAGVPVSGELTNLNADLIGHYRSELRQVSRSTPGPIWQEDRQLIDVTGDNLSWASRLVKKLFIDRVVRKWRALPETQAWWEREEWKSGRHFRYVDHTDFDFYQENPNTLRVTNKIMSPLALAEALQKRNAYARSLTWKARYFDQQMPRLHINEAGVLELPVINLQTQEKVSALNDHDSALWTAMYLLSQVLRYEKTGSAEAYQNAKLVIDGLVSLVDIVPDPKEFARTMMLSPSHEVWSEEWEQGQGEYSHLKWKKGGNNDMVKGVLLGFILSHRILKDTDKALMLKIRRVLPKLLTLKTNTDKDFNMGLAYAAYALWTKDTRAIEDFAIRVNGPISWISDGLDADSGFHFGGVADWSGMHLIAVSSIAQILASEELIKAFPRDEKIYFAKQTLNQAQERLYEIWRGFKDAHRPFMTAFLYKFGGEKYAQRIQPEELQEVEWILREVPAPRFQGHAKANLSIRDDWSLSSWPTLPWKAVRKELVFADRVQGAYSYPLYEALAWTSTYFWKDNPFTPGFESNPEVIPFGVDYLLVFWMSDFERDL